jgi:predicted MFS family arabinose efflux permease
VGALVPATVFALLADVHGKNRDAAYSEANAVCYAFAILAPLSMGLCLSLGLGWRTAVLFGMALGGAIALFYVRTPVPESRRVAGQVGGVLPPAYWAYWAALGLGCAVEFCVLLWAPSFLEQVGGLSKPWAATCAAAFALAMLVARTAGSALVRRYSTHQLFVSAILVALLGFVLYWALGSTFLVVPGLFVLGLGVALFYPLLLGLAVGAAGELGDLASARTMLAVGIAVLTMPALLGGLADEVGLSAAHLMLPVLVVLVFGCFLLAQALERRALQPA